MQNQWNYHLGITYDDLALFQDALGDNAKFYQPLAVAHLDNIRFRFIVDTVPGPELLTKFLVIEIYKPSTGPAYVTKILPININV